MPQIIYLDKNGKRLPDSVATDKVAFSVYQIQIRPGIMYQPHPAFATDGNGKPLYMDLTAEQLEKIEELSDFKKTGTRELTAADYVYQIKRLASPKVQSPIFGLMSEYIVGLKEYAGSLKKIYADQRKTREEAFFFDLIT